MSDLADGAVRGVARLGPFFAIETGDEDGWPLARDTYAGGWPERVAAVARQIGAAETRVAASTVQFGYAARLWSLAFGCALLHGVVLDLSELRLSPARAPAPALTLRLPSPRALPSPGDLPLPGDVSSPPAQATATLPEQLYQQVAEMHLRPLAEALRGRVAEGLLWGNAASAVVGSLRVIVAARPGVAQPAHDLAERMLDTGKLRGTGELSGTDELSDAGERSDTGELHGTGVPGQLNFRRRSCCLFYRVPGGGLCGDCSLRR
jgi:hypothetical protein